MHHHILGLDGVAMAVGNLETGAETFRRLGFTPLQTDTGYCLNFAQDHMQLLAGQGPTTLLFGTNHIATTAQALRQAGVEMATDQDFALDATSGIASRLVHREAAPVSHPAPASHPNGVTAIVSVTAVVEDPSAQATAWDRIFGHYTATLTDNTLAIHTGATHTGQTRGLVFLSRLDDLTQLHPDADEDETPPPPSIAAIVFRVTDTDSTATLLRSNGIKFSRDTEGALRIPPSEACGMFLELVGA